MGANPWRELRHRTEVELRWLVMPEGVRGAWWIEDGQRVIALAHNLDRRTRRAVLMHELVHDERGIAYHYSTPAALSEKEEAAVNRIATNRLVPPAKLIRFIDRQIDAEGAVTAADVADEFDVPHDVADRALRLLDFDIRVGRRQL